MNPGTRLFKVSSQSIWLAPDYNLKKGEKKEWILGACGKPEARLPQLLSTSPLSDS